MIDTHCHLLPALDDGPRDLRGSIALARQLADAGVSTVVCTPHFSRLYPTTPAESRLRLTDLRVALANVRLGLELRLAAEVSPALAASAAPEELVARRMGRFLLVELQPDTPAPFVRTVVERLAKMELRPVLAHPERCPAAWTQPSLLDEARAAGALIQVVASSVTGRFGSETEQAAWRLLGAGRVDLLASDAHRARPGGSHLGRAVALIGARFGSTELDRLTKQNPAQIVEPAAPRA